MESYCDECCDKPIQVCKICEFETCDKHGNFEYCGSCSEVMKRIDETKQKPGQCYFAKCQIKPNAHCGFCKRRTCNLHKIHQDCIRCSEEKRKLQNNLKEDDKCEKDESKRAEELSPELYKTYLMAKICGDIGGFWYCLERVKNEF
jgi:hypothetical protein